MSKGALQSTLGIVVREHRERVGLSQEELAARAGLHRTYVSLLERGERNPSLQVLSQLAAGLALRLSALIADVESPRTISIDRSAAPRRRATR